MFPTVYLNRGIRFPGFRRLLIRSRENMTAVSPESAYLLPCLGNSSLERTTHHVITYDRCEFLNSTVGGRPTGMPRSIRRVASPACPSMNLYKSWVEIQKKQQLTENLLHEDWLDTRLLATRKLRHCLNISPIPFPIHWLIVGRKYAPFL